MAAHKLAKLAHCHSHLKILIFRNCMMSAPVMAVVSNRGIYRLQLCSLCEAHTPRNFLPGAMFT